MSADLIVGVAGLPGSGKSTLAAALAPRLNASLFSFGDFFRAKAAGADLQAFGHDFVTTNKPEYVVNQFLQFYESRSHNRLVIEGIRHTAIWNALREHSACACLIFLEVEEDTLLQRLAARANVRSDDPRSRLVHAVEAEVSQLRRAAEIILNQHSTAQSLSRVMDAIADLP